jgi:hypothetical protein
LIPSRFAVNGVSETDIYRFTLKKLGLGEEQIETVAKGNETVGQINAALRYASKNNAGIIIVWACREHYWRWRLIRSWITVPAGVNLDEVRHEVCTTGLPRPLEFVTDIAILPIIFVSKIHPSIEKWVRVHLIFSVRKKRKRGKV